MEKVSKYDFQRDDVSSLTNKSSSRYKSNYSKKANVSLKKMKNGIFQKKVLFNTDNSVKETNDINCLKLKK